MAYDTIVLGAGLAGMLAALGRSERGERVLVLAKGHGATHWAAGCIDLFGAATN
ncbi:MAG: FAD-binding protein, partial [Chloroflexales bacterium]